MSTESNDNHHALDILEANSLGTAHEYHTYSDTASQDVEIEEEVDKLSFAHNIHEYVELSNFTTIPELLAAAMTYKGMSTRPLVIPNIHILNAIPEEWKPHLKHIKVVTKDNTKSLDTNTKLNPSILNGTFRNYWMLFDVNIKPHDNEDAKEKEAKDNVT